MRFSLCILLFGITCCSLAGTAQVEIEIPRFPSEWQGYPETPAYILTYTSPEAGEVEKELPPLTETVTIHLNKGNNMPVLLIPFFGQREYFFRPAGALFPLHCTGQGRLTMSWDEGFLADLMVSLKGETVYPEHINGARMSDAIGEAGEGDPWSLNKERIIQTFKFNSFREDYISLLPRCTLDIKLSEGCYLWNNAFIPPFYADTAGVYTFDSLYEGEHILFPLNGSEPLRVVITGNEWFIFYPEYAESGSW